MSRTVWKYVLEIKNGPQLLKIPSDSRLLHVAEQHGQPSMWFEVGEGSVPLPRSFYIVGTGHEIPRGVDWVGTFQAPPFVWHIYEVF